MSKTISTDLQNSVRAPVTTLAFCVEIRRRDGRVIRMTNHDTDIVHEEKVYRHDIPFSSSAISSGSQFQVDNVELMLFTDDTVIVREDFLNGLYDHADCSIMYFDYEHPEYGPIKMARGWFGPIDHNQHQVINITVLRLLKILDFEVGRVYQPSCDADLGDSRCKVAIKQNQIYSLLNPYYVGQWVYAYDVAEMTEISLVNHDFEDDGARTSAQAITGWNKGAGTAVRVDDGITLDITLDPFEGTYSLYGAIDAITPLGSDHYVWREIDLDAEGLDLGDIDDGQISVAYFAVLAQLLYFADPVRIRFEALDDNREITIYEDTGYRQGPRDDVFNAFDVWRELALVMPLLPSSRYLRVYVYFLKEDGTNINCAADRIRLYWWNHVAGTPYQNTIQHLVRIVNNDESAVYYPRNSSFEANNDVANAVSPVITGWTTTGSWWRVDNDLASLPALDGTRYLIGGDDGSATQQTYVITQAFNLLTDAKLAEVDIDLGKIVGRFEISVGWGDISLSAASVSFEFRDEDGDPVGSEVILTAEMSTSVTWADLFRDFVMPVGSRTIGITLEAISPVAASAANIGFEGLRFYFHHAEQSKKTDPIIAFGNQDIPTVFETTPGAYTFDQNLIWKTVSSFLRYDVVASVTDHKSFTATTMVGDEGTYELGVVRWLSGANAGIQNVIRTWNPDTKGLKLYFRTPYTIQPGDRFLYVRSCQKRFLEDCQAVFDNQINFRGFPHLPGRLTEDT